MKAFGTAFKILKGTGWTVKGTGCAEEHPGDLFARARPGNARMGGRTYRAGQKPRRTR
jgi:hypothetical protein